MLGNQERNETAFRILAGFVDVYAFVLSAALLAYLLTGCASIPPVKIDDSKFYARNAQMEVNHVKGRGTLVIPRNGIYEIRIKSEADMDFLLIQSCSREVAVEKAGDDFTYRYVPAPGLEDNRACPLSFIGIEKGQGRRSVGWLDFQDSERYDMPAETCCNGVCSTSPGVSACESGQGLLQRIAFHEPVYYDTARPECVLTGAVSGEGEEIEFKIPRGECTHLFVTKGSPHRWHRLSTYGFDESIPQRSK